MKRTGPVHGVKNLAHAMTIAQEALRKFSRHNISPTQNYVVVNYRPRGVPPDKVTQFQLCDSPGAIADVTETIDL